MRCQIYGLYPFTPFTASDKTDFISLLSLSDKQKVNLKSFATWRNNHQTCRSFFSVKTLKEKKMPLRDFFLFLCVCQYRCLFLAWERETKFLCALAKTTAEQNISINSLSLFLSTCLFLYVSKIALYASLFFSVRTTAPHYFIGRWHLRFEYTCDLFSLSFSLSLFLILSLPSFHPGRSEGSRFIHKMEPRD